MGRPSIRELPCKRLLTFLAILVVINLAGEAFYVYKTRSFISDWYERHFGETETVGDIPAYVPGENALLQQRSEAFSLIEVEGGDKQAVVFVGDSITETFPWAEHFADVLGV